MKGSHTEIKICGITRLEDALCAADMRGGRRRVHLPSGKPPVHYA